MRTSCSENSAHGISYAVLPMDRNGGQGLRRDAGTGVHSRDEQLQYGYFDIEVPISKYLRRSRRLHVAYRSTHPQTLSLFSPLSNATPPLHTPPNAPPFLSSQHMVIHLSDGGATLSASAARYVTTNTCHEVCSDRHAPS
eukprot:6181849-Pleurochrysis_carterae.AAC.1